MVTDGAVNVGLVHDYLLVMRGAERTFAQIADLWPTAPIYTLLYDHGSINGRFHDHEIRTSYLQVLRARQTSFRRLLPLFAGAVERLDTSEHDLIVSSSSAFAHGIPVPQGAQHVCYCHTPFRYAWHDYARTLRRSNPTFRPLIGHTLSRLRNWDRRVARGVTHYIANSELSRQRIQDFWGRDAAVVHPPVEVDRFNIGEPEDYFLIVAELVDHKRVELALEAGLRVGQKIKVVGHGPELRRLEAIYGSTAEFLGRVGDVQLSDLYARARALVVPNVEEFGIAAVEAQAAGRPVIAASIGGTCETVLDGQTGVLVSPENAGALAEAMTQTDFDRFEPEGIRRHALQFSPEAFKRRLADEIERVTGIRPPAAPPRLPPQTLREARAGSG